MVMSANLVLKFDFLQIQHFYYCMSAVFSMLRAICSDSLPNTQGRRGHFLFWLKLHKSILVYKIFLLIFERAIDLSDVTHTHKRWFFFIPFVHITSFQFRNCCSNEIKVVAQLAWNCVRGSNGFPSDYTPLYVVGLWH